MTQVLVIIDLQRDFTTDPDSKLCVAGGADCIPRVQAAVDHARATGIPVIWVKREHDPSGVDVERFRKQLYGGTDAPGPCAPGSTGAELAITPVAGELTIVKKRFSAFFGTPLDVILRRLNAERIVIAGVQTPNCIRATAFDAIALDYPKVTVLADGTAAASEAVQEANLSDMREVGIDTPTVAEWSGGGSWFSFFR